MQTYRLLIRNNVSSGVLGSQISPLYSLLHYSSLRFRWLKWKLGGCKKKRESRDRRNCAERDKAVKKEAWGRLWMPNSPKVWTLSYQGPGAFFRASYNTHHSLWVSAQEMVIFKQEDNTTNDPVTLATQAPPSSKPLSNASSNPLRLHWLGVTRPLPFSQTSILHLISRGNTTPPSPFQCSHFRSVVSDLEV